MARRVSGGRSAVRGCGGGWPRWPGSFRPVRGMSPHARRMRRGPQTSARTTLSDRVWTRLPEANRQDAPQFTKLMGRIRIARTGGGRPRTRPVRVIADRAYSSRAIRTHLRRRQIAHTIPEKRDQAGHRLRRGSAGGRPPSFDRDLYKRRHKVECRIGLLKQARGVATRYDKLAVRYEATVQLTLIRQSL
ncbi:transposase [Streptomyces sp. NPDC003077]|uniref:transposase n=1 Tax=Streptomyces sp. NPDC003077 TaxID=3154443 RepID=UPI0033A865BC